MTRTREQSGIHVIHVIHDADAVRRTPRALGAAVTVPILSQRGQRFRATTRAGLDTRALL